LKILCILFVMLMLTGCTPQPVLEKVEDPWVEVAAREKELVVKLPADAAAPALQSDDGGRLYLCDGYTLTLQTFSGGDLDATMRQVTGFSGKQLTCIETERGELKEYSCVWSSAGEGGDYVGRAVILDDGSYHYAVSVMADFATAGELTQPWQELLNSVSLSDTD
jgi:hypothetical protein